MMSARSGGEIEGRVPSMLEFLFAC